MRFILPDNLKFAKRFIEKTFFGALKIHNKATLKDRFLVETVFIDANQYIWCCCADELPVATDKFPVSLKYVDKEKGIYMKVTGTALKVKSGLQLVSEAGLDDAIDELTDKRPVTLLKIKMTETVYYKKNNGQINFYAVAS
ncbi:hypothetical protein HB364_14560 [Pseudoflavitalea sp. X16]|uniref:hypothetical protein n=1 Tax=Paraflavitalea devenefica TaxID=2716334 RepID=UPI001420C80C|nr:hypothetical protein [Paraflavitalea devenefica]NII26310.1 hypothetical protein [Paraflavitalea devenefica]